VQQVIGFVGVGQMGGPMAARLLDAGHALCVFDASEAAMRPLVERGARCATSPAHVASEADVVMLSLPTPPVVQAVALGQDGIVRGSRARTVVDLSTTGPSTAAAAARALGEHQIVWVDSPVSGGVTGAAAGTLAVIVSCPQATFREVDPLLRTFGRTFYVGDRPGLAQVAKLANNMLSAAAMVVSSEAMAMGVKAGLDPRVLVEIFNAGSGRNSATQDKIPRCVLPRTFDLGFAIGLSLKDLRLCVDEAEALGVPMVVGAAVRQMIAVASARFGPEADFTCIARVLEEWAGVELRG
jgi:3-hydroxyisobutyrate dehydrogenase-like beta-hydroxyacid dehydrogenase